MSDMTKTYCHTTRSVGFYPLLTMMLLTWVIPASAADPGEAEYVVIKAGRVITISGQEYAPGTIVIEDGKVTLVGGGKIEYPPMAKVIEAAHETVMPGFIHPRSRFGLTGYKRSGVHGDQKVADEVYLETIDFQPLLEAGYTAICLTPSGEGITGLAGAFRTAGPEEVRLLSDQAYLHANISWRSKGKQTLRDALKKAKSEIEKVEKARKEWEEKQKTKQTEAEKKKDSEGKPQEEKEEKKEENKFETNSASSPDSWVKPADEDDENEKKKSKEEKFEAPAIDSKYQPLVDLIEQKEGVRMMVKLSKASDLRHLEDVLEPYEDMAPSLYLTTRRQTDYHYVVEALGERNAQVLVRPWIHYLPYTTFRYNLLTRLVSAGCEVSVLPFSDDRLEFIRVRQRLADAVRAGLPREDALKMLTLHPAKLLGLGERLGSLEKEKEADLTFLSGDPLDPHTRVTRVMILGKVVWERDEP